MDIITDEDVKGLVRALFEPQAAKWLSDIKEASPEPIPEPLQEIIIKKLCEAYIAGIEQGAKSWYCE